METSKNVESSETSNNATPANASLARIAGWLAFILAGGGMILICLGDPVYLALPVSILAIAAARFALRRGWSNHVGAHLGFNLALFNVLLWFIIIALLNMFMGISTDALFRLPALTS